MSVRRTMFPEEMRLIEYVKNGPAVREVYDMVGEGPLSMLTIAETMELKTVMPLLMMALMVDLSNDGILDPIKLIPIIKGEEL